MPTNAGQIRALLPRQHGKTVLLPTQPTPRNRGKLYEEALAGARTTRGGAKRGVLARRTGGDGKD